MKRQLPHLGDAGQGVNRQPCISATAGRVIASRGSRVGSGDLQSAMEGARVCCGDWSRIMSPGTMTRNGTAAVMLDPPIAPRKPCTRTTPARSRTMQGCGASKTETTRAFGLPFAATTRSTTSWSCWAGPWRHGPMSGGYQGADDRERIWFSRRVLSETSEQIDLFAPARSVNIVEVTRRAGIIGTSG